MFPYSEEQFTADEEAVLRRYVTNLDQPVFALVNLPEVVKGALFARYSRSPKSLRRLFLDEFVGELDVSGDATVDATVGLARAEQLYEKVFVEYGDDSVAQLGGVHLACEQASNVLSKVLEWGRLMAYLEQSTRYIAYNQRLENGQYRYFRPPEILDSSHGARFVGEMDRVFDTYGALLPRMQAWVAERFPQQAGDSDFVYRQATRAKSLDALRGLLPAASLSNIGIYGTGQSYEQLLLRMRAHPLPEARHYADMMLFELRKVIPSFLQRVDVPARGGEWSDYLSSTQERTSRLVSRLWPELEPLDTPRRGDEGEPEVTLVDFDPDGEEKVLVAACFSHLGCSEREAARRGPASRPRGPGRAAARRTWAIGAIGGTGPVAPSSEPTTASNSSPTTAPSATCSAIGCSPSSGSAWVSHSATTCPHSSPTRASANATTRRSTAPRSSTARCFRTSPSKPRTSSRWRTASVTSCSSTRARRCTSLSSAREPRATPRIEGWPSRCTGPSPRSPATAPWPKP